MLQGFSKLYPGPIFNRNIASFRWEPAGHSNNPYVRLEYSYNSAGYPSMIGLTDSPLAEIEFVYKLVKK